MTDGSSQTEKPLITQTPKSTIREVHRPNLEKVKKMFEERGLNVPDNRGLISDNAKELTRKELEGGIDALTGLHNKKSFDKRFFELVKVAHRDSENLEAIVLDADGLKSINDKFGHKAGDTYISTVGRLLTQNLRAGDLAGRVGGDEFIVILRNSANEGFKEWWKRQNILFQEHQVAISAGRSPIDLDHPQESLKNADKAMYESKRLKDNGKNNFTEAITDDNNILTFKQYKPESKQKAA
ncbi:MAG: GGDEF domain-containing protein [Candidatus Levybacteria bacterium]|nr:GGDEF domain-containing protein [Candidatus Levybacteria bacterium]MBP9815468.1 GGDEF domain-containing protein [Candidatus Levybacteria bacterium]